MLYFVDFGIITTWISWISIISRTVIGLTLQAKPCRYALRLMGTLVVCNVVQSIVLAYRSV